MSADHGCGGRIVGVVVGVRAARFSLARRTSGTATAPTDITAARARSTRGGSPGDISMMAAQPARTVSST
ncbi:hypothetical protein [Streptomyces sp. GB4-14]|uniref:hypothetical protein n=1 Tax=Streptomyces sp. GB4-14 TaxID=2498703 RepID=UPI001F5D3D6B